MLAVGSSILAGCRSDENTENTKTNSLTKETTEMTSSSKEESKSKDEPESVEFVAKENYIYIVRTNIEPGTYYAVLTELNHGERDTDKNAYVSMNIHGNTRKIEMLRDIGTKQ